MPSQSRRWILAVAAFALVHCRSRPEPPRHLLLVTFDTLRADRLGCYGSRDVETPNFDRLAREGAMAERATVHVPLTRPSHISLFTGMLPTRHGVRDNISPARVPDVPTLATVMKAEGFRTAAFVSSLVLASGGGLERGFDLYSDDFGSAERGEDMFMTSLQKRGDETIEEATAWLASNREARLFTWIHLYDPHEPYEPPEPYRSRYSGRPYDGEVAWSDELLGRLDRALEKLGLAENTLLVVTSDHGEGLGEHRETLHGFFIYESTLSVPLLVRGPGVVPGSRLARLVRTVDLFPTLVEMMGIETPVGVELSGASFVGALRGGPPPAEPAAYAETLVPLLHFGWSDLRAIRRGKWKYIQAPRPELYDLEADPMEIENLAAEQPDLIRGMRGALGQELERERAAGAGEVTAGSVPQELLDKLGALGYVGAGRPIETRTPGADPKDKIDEFRVANELMQEGILRFHEGDYTGSAERYRKLLALEIESFEVHFNLARSLLSLGRPREAEPHFAEATRRLPSHAAAWEGLAQCRSARGDLAGALDAVKEGQQALPEDAALLQREGAILVRMGKPAEARRAYEAAVERAPKDALMRARLGELLRDQGEIEESIRRLREALEIAPGRAAYWNSLAMILGGNGRLAEAEEAFREAVRLDGKNPRYAFNLGLILVRQNRREDARPFFETALALEPRFEEARRYLQELDGK
jgi:arylsulfatase A-like enzyme/Flp pilus assembly protein TadD